MPGQGLLRHLWQTQKLALAVLALSLLALGWFGIGFLTHAKRFNHPAHVQQPLEPWMTPRFVGRSYQIPPKIARELFQVEPGSGERPTMATIAEKRGLTLTALEALVKQAAEEARKARER